MNAPFFFQLCNYIHLLPLLLSPPQRWDRGQRVQGSVGTYGLEQVTPLQRPTGLPHHHSVWNGSLAAAGTEVRGTHDGGAGRGGHSHPGEVDASGHSVAAISETPLSPKTLGE